MRTGERSFERSGGAAAAADATGAPTARASAARASRRRTVRRSDPPRVQRDRLAVGGLDRDLVEPATMAARRQLAQHAAAALPRHLDPRHEPAAPPDRDRRPAAAQRREAHLQWRAPATAERRARQAHEPQQLARRATVVLVHAVEAAMLQHKREAALVDRLRGRAHADLREEVAGPKLLRPAPVERPAPGPEAVAPMDVLRAAERRLPVQSRAVGAL